MRIIRGIGPDLVPASAVTLGMFDGVHRGHQVLLAACRAHADALGLPAVALTYEPHPSHVLRPDLPTPLLTTLDEKLDLLARHGMDVAVVAEFTRTFSQLEAGDFIRSVLCHSLHPVALVAGYRTTFGHDRGGNAALLGHLAHGCAFEVEIVPPVEVAGGPVSSSRIRQLLLTGELAEANTLLGYPYRMRGTVVAGDGRGRTLGIPTANLDTDTDTDKLVPAEGIYAVDVDTDAGRFRGAMNIGARPTFGRPRTLEVHLLDFAGDLYGARPTITFLARLRDVRTFATVEALLAQITDDIAQARAVPILNP